VGDFPRPRLKLLPIRVVIQDRDGSERALLNAFSVRGRYYQWIGDLDRALAEYDEALRSALGKEILLWQPGDVYFRKADFDRADLPGGSSALEENRCESSLSSHVGEKVK
jgi:tetratricopeptide (TPR) repeat protein